MHPNLKDLLQLQGLDLRLAELGTELQRYPRRVAELDAQIQGARSAVAAAREAQITNAKERKKLELDVESWKEKVRKYKDQSSQIKTNEAYRTLLHEIETAEAEIRKAEDAVLEHMVLSEDYDHQVKAAEKVLAETEASAKQLKQQIDTERGAIEQQQGVLRAERERAAAVVPADLYERYSIYGPRHHGVVVAILDGEACSGCRVHLRPYVVQRLRRADYEQIVECESCGRMLYAPEPAPAAAGAGTADPAPAHDAPEK
jgi:predicted  nucleic acid-binding Zn-ribbon protein